VLCRLAVHATAVRSDRNRGVHPPRCAALTFVGSDGTQLANNEGSVYVVDNGEGLTNADGTR
jgi:hypothetical protein